MRQTLTLWAMICNVVLISLKVQFMKKITQSRILNSPLIVIIESCGGEIGDIHFLDFTSIFGGTILYWDTQTFYCCYTTNCFYYREVGRVQSPHHPIVQMMHIGTKSISYLCSNAILLYHYITTWKFSHQKGFFFLVFAEDWWVVTFGS